MKTNTLRKNDINSIFYYPASEVLTEGQYIESVKSLILKSLSVDPTLVLHCDEDIGKRFPSSIIAIDDNFPGIIGNSSLYPTTFPSLQNICDESGRSIRIGETGSSVIDPDYRNRGLGRRLIMEADESLGIQYDAIIGATVNTVMRDIRINELGYELAPFPSDLYEEGKIYLAPKMLGGIKEFEEKAVCIIKFRIDSVRQKILTALDY